MRGKIIILALSTATLAGCNMYPRLEDAQYWQRKSATSALYLQGPKAQQSLHQDIATCTNEIAELQRLSAVRAATRGETFQGRVPDRDTPEGRMAGWETPERDGYLRAEHSDYHDFETCMDSKGWERMEYLPYAEADKARSDYARKRRVKKAGSRENVESIHSASQNPAPYKNLND